jgi:plastocyanin
MVRRLILGVCVVLAMLAGSRCNDDTVTGPAPIPQATATPTPPGAPTAKPTPPGAPTATPTPPGVPTATPTPPSTATATVDVGSGGGFVFRDRQSGTSTTTIRPGDSVQWVWVSDVHSTTSGSCPGGACQPDGQWDSGAAQGITFTHTFPQAGSFPYFCTVHGSMMQGMVLVQ